MKKKIVVNRYRLADNLSWDEFNPFNLSGENNDYEAIIEEQENLPALIDPLWELEIRPYVDKYEQDYIKALESFVSEADVTDDEVTIYEIQRVTDDGYYLSAYYLSYTCNPTSVYEDGQLIEL